MPSLSDRPALGALLLDAEPALARLAERLCTNSADARDLVQDTFERAARQGVPDDVRSPRAWLTTILHNLFVDRCRAAARRPRHEPLDEGLSATAPEPRREPAWSQIEVADVRAALAEIDSTYSEVFELHTFGHCSYEELAERLSIQRVTVGTRLNRARKKLRDVLARRFRLELELEPQT